MLERFTERGRRVIDLARDEARGFGHSRLGTEHLLLGVLREQGPAARLLASLRLTLEGVRSQTVKLIGSDEDPSPSDVPFTPNAKAVLERALREALPLSSSITPEHILLALVRTEGGVAARVLTELGAAPAVVGAGVLELLGVMPGSEAPPKVATHRPASEPWTETVASSSFDLGESARRALALAEEESRDLGFNFVNTDHLLLGLLRVRDGVAARVLAAAGVTAEAIRADHWVSRGGSGHNMPPKGTPLPLVPAGKRALERAGGFAEGGQIETEHVLLGVIAVNDSSGPRVLLELGVFAERLREVIEATREAGRPPPDAANTARTPPRLTQNDHVTWGFREALHLARHEAVMRERTHVSADDLLRGLLQVEREGYPGHGARDLLLAGTWPLLGGLMREVEDQLDRPLDAGDLLVVLASAPGAVVAEALAAFAIDIDALARAVAEARRRGARAELFYSSEFFDQLERFDEAVRSPTEEEPPEELGTLRGQMRERLADAEEDLKQRIESVLADIRRRLELAAE